MINFALQFANSVIQFKCFHSNTLKMGKLTGLNLLTSAKDYFFIVFGIMLYALGFTAFILPHAIVIGGLSGISTLVYYATDGLIPVAATIYVLNILLLACGFKILGRRFVLRTIFGATMMSLFVGIFEGYFMSLPQPLIPDITMSAVLGGIVIGISVGTIFIHNGSSGGTDIVAAMVSKVSNVSIGRAMMITDMLIVASSILLPYDGTFQERITARMPLMIYGWVVTFLVSYITDLFINSPRQATQFTIFSHKWEEIATRINQEAQRGVTVMDGQGWYSKQPVKVLMVWCRKTESVTIFRIIKSIDEKAFISTARVNGVYGKGFDVMRVKIPKHQSRRNDAADASVKVLEQ